MKKYFYTWEKFDEDIEKISRWAGDRGFSDIYGVPRGGLIAAVALSHRLGVPLNLDLNGITQKTLVIDDISDSGKTLLALEKTLSFKPLTAALFYYSGTARRPDFAAREKKEWVVFPWETEQSSRCDDSFVRAPENPGLPAGAPSVEAA